MLDLIISSEQYFVEHDELLVVKVDNHHPALSVIIKDMNAKEVDLQSHILAMVYNFRKANYPALYCEPLEQNWRFLEICYDVDIALKLFHDKLYYIPYKHVPRYRTYKRQYPK
nr:unnamed protein product [Callosobruchus analis]